jgi:hypothetical protein
VTTHVPSSTLAARLPAMWGMETLTTVVSSSSMKVASITETVTIPGLTWGCSGWAALAGPVTDQASAGWYGGL